MEGSFKVPFVLVVRLFMLVNEFVIVVPLLLVVAPVVFAESVAVMGVV